MYVGCVCAARHPLLLDGPYYISDECAMLIHTMAGAKVIPPWAFLSIYYVLGIVPRALCV